MVNRKKKSPIGNGFNPTSQPLAPDLERTKKLISLMSNSDETHAILDMINDDEEIDDDEANSNTFDISFIELAILNGFLHSVYKKGSSDLKIDHFGWADGIGRVSYGSTFDVSDSFWYLGSVSDDSNSYIFQTKLFKDTNNTLISQFHISTKTGTTLPKLEDLFKKIKKIAFNNSNFKGKCLKVKLFESKFRGIEIIDVPKNNELILSPTQDKYVKNFKNRVKRGSNTRYLFNGVPGSGKAQPLDTKILTPNCWTTMGNIKLNDEILTPEGKVSKVIGIYPQGKKEIYKITFADGRSTEACGEHLWKVYGIPYGKNRKKSWSILNTLEIKNKFETTKYKLKTHLVSEEINIKQDTNFIIDPYLMGVLLGDGSFKESGIGISSSDIEILDQIRNLIPDEYNLVYDTGYDYLVTRKEGKGYKKGVNGNQLVKEIRQFNLSDKKSYNKFIPDKYKNLSFNQKLSLLQGLMDTDGTVDKGSHISYSTTSLQLAKDIQELIWSIGGICKISEKQTNYTYKGEKKAGRLSYNLHIRYKQPKDLFRLSRKKNRLPDNYQYSDKLKNTFKSVEYIGKKEAQCIMIEDESHLYITDDYIVTHNTESIRDIIRDLMPEVTFIIPDFTTIEDLTTILEACEIFDKAVVIMDDIDLFLGSRDHGSYTRLLGEFLSFFDGVKKRKISLLASTNDKGLVDSAAERPGRFNLTLDYTFLTEEQIQKVCDIHLPEAYRVKEVYAALTDKIDGKQANITGAFISNLAENIREMSQDDENWTLEDTIDLIKESYRGFYSSQIKNDKKLGFKL